MIYQVRCDVSVGGVGASLIPFLILHFLKSLNTCREVFVSFLY